MVTAGKEIYISVDKPQRGDRSRCAEAPMNEDEAHASIPHLLARMNAGVNEHVY